MSQGLTSELHRGKPLISLLLLEWLDYEDLWRIKNGDPVFYLQMVIILCSGNAERSLSDDQSSAVNLPSLDSSKTDSQSVDSTETELGSQIPKVPSNGSVVTSKQKQEVSSAGIKSTPIRSSRLTAREKLRAARVLSRKTEPKSSKRQLGSKVLEFLKESDRGKRRSGLPEAPTNLLDDSKRGMPKKVFTSELSGGADVFLFIFSVVFISTVMFTTTYIAWKVGAIHFKEY